MVVEHGWKEGGFTADEMDSTSDENNTQDSSHIPHVTSFVPPMVSDSHFE